MKRVLRSVVAATLIGTFIMSMVACGVVSTKTPTTASETTTTTTQSNTKPVENVKLSVWINAYMTSEEQKNPQDQWTISKIFKKFEAENPGVTIEMTVPADQQAAHQTFKAAAMAKNGPDIANLWTGVPLFALKDVVLPLDGKVPQEDLDNILGWDTVRENFSPTGTILGYPASGIDMGALLYNKKLLSAAGLDFDTNPPKTPDELMAALDTIKKSGVTPILADDGAVCSLYVFIFGTWWTQVSGTERIMSNSLGKTKFADDKGFLDTLSKVAEMYKKGYINKDYLSSKDSTNKFNQGKGAILVSGNWGIQDAVTALGETNVGILPVPLFTPDVKSPFVELGGAGQSLVIANYTKNPDLSIKLCSFINNKENTIAISKIQSKVSLRKDVTAADLGWSGKAVFEKSLEMVKNIGYWTDNSQQADVMNEYYKQATLVIIGKETALEAAQKLDKKALEVNK